MIKKSIFLLLLAATARGGIQFKKKMIRVGDQALHVELAESGEEHERGLMFRRELSDGSGMLFIFEKSEPRRFWMKNTFIDLDIGYFNDRGELFDVQMMEAAKSELETNLRTYPSSGPAKYALEVPKGWFQRRHVKKGDKLVLK